MYCIVSGHVTIICLFLALLQSDTNIVVIVNVGVVFVVVVVVFVVVFVIVVIVVVLVVVVVDFFSFLYSFWQCYHNLPVLSPFTN